MNLIKTQFFIGLIFFTISFCLDMSISENIYLNETTATTVTVSNIFLNGNITIAGQVTLGNKSNPLNLTFINLPMLENPEYCLCIDQNYYAYKKNFSSIKKRIDKNNVSTNDTTNNKKYKKSIENLEKEIFFTIKKIRSIKKSTPSPSNKKKQKSLEQLYSIAFLSKNNLRKVFRNVYA